jgi:alkanesulfonate monooxygenase SsuD/methylene tetrahydromethanopterin reductase-like flavin-dependent oxidoreductase (luciferase family)
MDGARALEATALAHGWQFPAAQVMAGTVTQLADQLAVWFHARAADGFVFGLPELTTDGALVGDVLIPELQRRGLFRTAYTGSTLRPIWDLPHRRTSMPVRHQKRF